MKDVSMTMTMSRPISFSKVPPCARWEPHTLERALAPGRSGLSAEINTTRVNTPRTPTGYKVK
eukprot:scaffold3107_cov73-Phaeocystis_antarctica.AAC.4